MGDNKYGPLYTRDDLMAIIGKCIDADVAGESEAYEIVREYKGKLSGDMPIFVLLAKDKTAAGTIRDYDARQSISAPKHHLDMVAKAHSDFEEWANHHPDKMKDPD
jgi:predicted MPP superfamily phosphohydrolase